MKKIGIAGTRKPKAGRKAGLGGKICFGPGCGAARKAGARKKAR
jgi:hypothetical protein